MRDPSKFNRLKDSYTEWWDNLSLDEKVLAKKMFISQSKTNSKLKYPYPDMPDISHLRLSQLTNAHKYRIWAFRDRDEKLNLDIKD